MYCTAFVPAVTGRASGPDTVSWVDEVSSNSAPPPFSTSTRGVGILSSWVIETGPAPFPDPHGEGRGPMSNSSTPPFARRARGSEVDVQARPSTFRPCTYTFFALFLGAVTTRSLPFSRCTVALANSGEPTAYSPLPITSG